MWVPSNAYDGHASIPRSLSYNGKNADHLSAHNPKRTRADPALPMFDITDRGHFADPNCARLRKYVESRGGTIRELGICVGTVIEGENVKLGELNDDEKDDL